MIRLGIRAFSGKTLIFSEHIECEEKELDAIAEEHIKRLLDYPKHMIEFEFLDEPDVNQRFLRIGTDPRGMVLPMSFTLARPPATIRKGPHHNPSAVTEGK